MARFVANRCHVPIVIKMWKTLFQQRKSPAPPLLPDRVRICCRTKLYLPPVAAEGRNTSYVVQTTFRVGSQHRQEMSCPPQTGHSSQPVLRGAKLPARGGEDGAGVV